MLLGILLAAVIVVCIALVGVILLQRSEGGVLGMSGGGGPGNFMSARGTGDLLTRATQILAGIFFSLCLIMTLVTGHMRREASIADKLKDLSIAPPPVSSQAPAQTPPATLTQTAPAAPSPEPQAPVGNGLNLFGPNTAPKPAVPALMAPTAAPAKVVAPKAASSAKPPKATAPAKPEASSAPPAASAAPAAPTPAAAPAPTAPAPAAAPPAAPPANQ